MVMGRPAATADLRAEWVAEIREKLEVLYRDGHTNPSDQLVADQLLMAKSTLHDHLRAAETVFSREKAAVRRRVLHEFGSNPTFPTPLGRKTA
jgi:hypothetical protein